jgi:hypothetical protein
MEDCYNAAKRQANMNLNSIDDLLCGQIKPYLIFYKGSVVMVFKASMRLKEKRERSDA